MRREESSTFSAILISILIFLFLSGTQARNLQQECSSSCGGIDICYPFYLKGDPEGNRDPVYQLSCQNNKTIIEFNSGIYYVKGISYTDHVITIVDVNLANETCSFPNSTLSAYKLMSYNGSLGGELGRRYTNVCFVRCFKTISNPAYIRVPCLGGNDQSIIFFNYGAYRMTDLPDSCSFISMVPVLYNKRWKYPSYETIRELLVLGFNLSWPNDCRKCYEYGYCCGYNTDRRYVCECKRSSLLLFLKQMFGSLRQSFLHDGFQDYEVFFLNSISYPIYIFAGFVNATSSTVGFLLGTLTRLLCVLLISRFLLGHIFLLVYVIHKYYKTRWKTVDNVEKFLHNRQSWMPKRYSYPEIMAVTNNFEEKLGQGGFGSVYKGQLQSGCLIAVKVLENSKFSAEEFINEVSTIGRIHHVNVVQLVGFCSEGSKRALVYEYMPNGSLDKHIFLKKGKGQSFNWERLHQIALGTARGIEYLHGGCDVCILHFDIKPHNILLDHNLIPKVADFGLAKFYPKENDFVSVSATRGTIGYIAPELISRNFGVVSCKSDVYSFGMLLLEMAGGRRNSNSMEARSSKAYFPSWVYDQINKGGDLELRHVNENEVAIARKLCIIGLWCIQVKAADRPSIIKVREMLEGSIDDLLMPPKPFFSSSQHVPMKESLFDSSTELLLSESIEEYSYSNNDV